MTCQGLQFEQFSEKLKWFVPQTAYVCRCTVTFLATPKTVRRTARVCSLNLENVATPKTVRWPAEVCSFRCLLRKLSVELQRSAVLDILISFYSENCPLTFQGLQFFVKKWKKCSLLRKLSVDLPPFAVWEPVRWPATVGSLNRSYFSGSNCQGLQVYGQFHKLQLVAGVPKWIFRYKEGRVLWTLGQLEVSNHSTMIISGRVCTGNIYLSLPPCTSSTNNTRLAEGFFGLLFL